MKLEGIHHITAITGDAVANVEFYRGVLGLRMVKKTVNQDDPTVYHLFYGDEHGSLASESGREGLVVLRSVGKFYGLAGIRAGFVLAAEPLRGALRETLGAWTVSGPARHAVQAALSDSSWQAETRAALARDSARLAALIRNQGFDPRSTPLFVWFETQNAAALQHALATRGIWTRLFEHGVVPSLRIGLTGSEAEWLRFAGAFEGAVGEIG